MHKKVHWLLMLYQIVRREQLCVCLFITDVMLEILHEVSLFF